MIREYAISRIDGVPPKKDGANSMWGKQEEVQNLIRLRQTVHDALKGAQPLSDNIHLSLCLHLKKCKGGDLDNLIWGIYDGLMKAHSQAKLCLEWARHEMAIFHPQRTIAIVDDSQVMSTTVTKSFGNDEPWYSITLRGN